MSSGGAPACSALSALGKIVAIEPERAHLLLSVAKALLGELSTPVGLRICAAKVAAQCDAVFERASSLFDRSVPLANVGALPWLSYWSQACGPGDKELLLQLFSEACRCIQSSSDQRHDEEIIIIVARLALIRPDLFLQDTVNVFHSLSQAAGRPILSVRCFKAVLRLFPHFSFAGGRCEGEAMIWTRFLPDGNGLCGPAADLLPYFQTSHCLDAGVSFLLRPRPAASYPQLPISRVCLSALLPRAHPLVPAPTMSLVSMLSCNPDSISAESGFRLLSAYFLLRRGAEVNCLTQDIVLPPLSSVSFSDGRSLLQNLPMEMLVRRCFAVLR